VDNVAAALEELPEDVKKEIAELWKDVSAEQLEIANLGTHSSSLGLPLLRIPQHLMFTEPADPIPESSAATPLPFSTVSNVLSGLSNLHLNMLMLESPYT
jgi:hypothetical protein